MIDNYDLFLKYEAEQESRLERLPTCILCGESIQDEYCYEINDELFCEECMKDEFRKNTENYIEGW